MESNIKEFFLSREGISTSGTTKVTTTANNGEFKEFDVPDGNKFNSLSVSSRATKEKLYRSKSDLPKPISLSERKNVHLSVLIPSRNTTSHSKTASLLQSPLTVDEDFLNRFDMMMEKLKESQPTALYNNVKKETSK